MPCNYDFSTWLNTFRVLKLLKKGPDGDIKRYHLYGKTYARFPENLETDLSQQLTTLLLGISTRKEIIVLQRHLESYVGWNSIYSRKIQNQSKCSLINGWLRKMWPVYTMEFYLAIKNVTASKKLEDIMSSSNRAGQKDK